MPSEIKDGIKAPCPDCGLTVILGFDEHGEGIGIHERPPCKTWDALELDEFATYLRQKAQGKHDA
jgi:hypothetical protein